MNCHYLTLHKINDVCAKDWQKLTFFYNPVLFSVLYRCRYWPQRKLSLTKYNDMKKQLSHKETWRNNYHMKKQLSHEETTLIWRNNYHMERQLSHEETTITWRDNYHMKKQRSHKETTITWRNNYHMRLITWIKLRNF
jgi:hypothetical protein